MSAPDDKPKEDFNKAAGKHPEMELEDLLPTQITLGMRAMRHKAHHIHHLKDTDQKALQKYFDERPIEVVLGPGGKAYIVDHHHLALAMLHEGYKKAQVHIVADFSDAKTQDEFWKKMEEGKDGKKFVHPYDENGEKQPISHIPKKLKDMIDDPYRSLAGLVRDMGGFTKVFTPFVEFQWADYFRKTIPKKLVDEHFNKALKLAAKICHLPAAAHLPGFVPEKKKQGPKAA